MGNYSVEISGFDSDAVGFSSTASSTSVGVGESKIVSFDGTYLRTAGVSGQVSVEGEGLGDVMVSLRGGPDNVDESTTTDAAGQYAFASLRAGTYTVGISGWDDTDFEFEVTSKSVTVALGETGYVEFEGELLRTSGLAGRVSAGGMGMAGVTVTLSGTADATANTDASGIYAFAGLAAGDYTVTISGYDAVEYSFDDSQTVTLEMDKTAIVNFDGMALRTASIKVMVTADGEGVPGVQARLTLVTGTASGTILGGGVTDADGMHTFGPLLAGNYIVDISGADDEIDFADGMSWEGPVATDGMAEANFAGMINRTGSIAGMVTADGEGMGGVTVTLGGAGDASMMTADDGSYSFSGLRRGDYTVSVTNPNADMYSFPTTSRAVSVAIGQAHTDVSFAGTMIRRSSISGQVSVEGMGLGGVAVMLSGAHEATDSTDASGQYVFNGLGGGSYTVSFENPNGDAYDFDATSAEVMVGNAEAATQNFTGMHTRTASVSGMLFVDEVDSNDMHDEGEEMLAAADIEVALIGPTIAMRQTANTDAEGNFTFENLRMGTYQLVVGAEGVPDDYGYGGPATGYELEVGAGMTTTQNIPFDITHQTVAFSVMLKSGDMTGDALPGATVTLYADMAGKDRVASGETDDDGMATIRFARADAGGDMVYAGVMAPEGDFDVAGDMQMVGWASKDKMTEASNSQDVVNLKAEVSFAGKTITTDLGGGMALAGWAIDVMMPGEGDEMVAVEGDDVPTMLDEEGMGSLTMMAESAADLPMTYYVQFDAAQDDDLDGGEKHETVDKAMYTHTGLKLATEADAGAATVRYTTATIKVYVHREVDQVHGYTGGVLAGDERESNVLDINVRYIADNGRSRSFTSDEWSRPQNSDGSLRYSAKGTVTFSNVPTDENVIVQASKVSSDQNIVILRSDELATYSDLEENGVMGGAFGPDGGYHHTVQLCPLMATDPTGQDFGKCGSFAYVETYAVDGQAWRNTVAMSTGGDGFTDPSEIGVPGTRVMMDPVNGKNLAGESESFTAANTNYTSGANARRGRDGNALDERKQFYFGQMAEGVYSVKVPSGWSASTGSEMRLTGYVNIDVTPSTGTLYGRVTGTVDGSPLDSVQVTVNGVTTMTDRFGRYIVDGFKKQASRQSAAGAILFLSVSGGGFDPLVTNPNARGTWQNAALAHAPEFSANNPTRFNISMQGTAATTTFSGTVTNTGDPVAGASIMVSYDDGATKVAPLNHATRGPNAGKLVTNADGTFSAKVEAGSSTAPKQIKLYATKYGQTIEPFQGLGPYPAVVGTPIPSLPFQAFTNATIEGTVRDKTSGLPLRGVTVKATTDKSEDETVTGETGIFILSASSGSVMIEASMEGYSFEYKDNKQTLDVYFGQTVTFPDIMATGTPSANTALSGVTVNGTAVEAGDDGNYATTVSKTTTKATVVATAAHADAKVTYDKDEDATTDGAQMELNEGANTLTVTVEAADESKKAYKVTITRASDVPSAPQRVTAMSSASGTLNVSWRSPADGGAHGVTGYQIRWNGTWVNATTNNTAGGSHEITDLIDGFSNTIWVRAYGRPDDGNSDGSEDVLGDSASVRATTWPTVSSVAFDPATIDEGAKSTMTITLSGRSNTAVRVNVSVGDDHEDLVSFGATAMVPAQQTTATVEVTSLDDKLAPTEGGTTTAVTFTAKIAEESAADRAQTATGDLTINDTDLAPSAPTGLTATPSSGSALLTWSHDEAWGTGAAGTRKFQYRVKKNADGAFGDSDQWVDIPGGADQRSHRVSDLDAVLYDVEVRATTEAGSSTAVTETVTPTS